MANLPSFDDMPSQGALPSFDAMPHEAPASLSGDLKAAGTGVVRGLEGLAGLPGDAAKGVGYLFDNFMPSNNTVRSVFGAAPLSDKETEQATAQGEAAGNSLLPSTQDIVNKETALTGGLHEAANPTEQHIENVASFIPGALGGPEGLVKNAVIRGVIPGVAAETAGTMAQGTPFETPARIAAAILATRGKNPVDAKTALTPDIADLKQATDTGYAHFRAMPFAVTPDSMEDWATASQKQINAINKGQGSYGNLSPQVSSLLDRFTNNSNPAVTAQDIDHVKGLLRGIQKGGGDEATAATIALKNLDERMNTFAPNQVVLGNKDAAASLWNDNQANYAAMKRSEAIAGLRQNAENIAASNNSGRNLGNKLRQSISSFVKNDGNTKGFNAAELAKMQQIIDGLPGQNAMRSASNQLGGGGGIGSSFLKMGLGEIGSEVGGMLGGWPGSMAGWLGGVSLPFVGGLLRKSYNKSVGNGLADLDTMVRQRSPLANQTIANLPVSKYIPNSVQRILNAAQAMKQWN